MANFPRSMFCRFAASFLAFVLIQTAPGLSVYQAVAQMRTTVAATGVNMNGGAPVRVEMALPSANAVLAPGSQPGLNPSLSVTNAVPTPVTPSVAVTPLSFIPAAAKSVSVIAAGPVFTPAPAANRNAASALVETGVALSKVPAVSAPSSEPSALLTTLSRFFDGSRAIEGSVLSAPAASDALRANVPDNLPVTLTMESFPVVSANYGPNIVKRIQQLIDKAQGGGISDIGRLGLAACALAQSLYIYNEPEAAKTRESGFQLVKYAAEHGDARAMYSAAHMLVAGEGTAQNFDEAKRLFKLIAVSEGVLYLEARKSLDKLESLIQKGTPPKPVTVETKIIGRSFSEIAAAKTAAAQEGVVTLAKTTSEALRAKVESDLSVLRSLDGFLGYSISMGEPSHPTAHMRKPHVLVRMSHPRDIVNKPEFVRRAGGLPVVYDFASNEGVVMMKATLAETAPEAQQEKSVETRHTPVVTVGKWARFVTQNGLDINLQLRREGQRTTGTFILGTVSGDFGAWKGGASPNVLNSSLGSMKEQSGKQVLYGTEKTPFKKLRDLRGKLVLTLSSPASADQIGIESIAYYQMQGWPTVWRKVFSASAKDLISAPTDFDRTPITGEEAEEIYVALEDAHDIDFNAAEVDFHGLSLSPYVTPTGYDGYRVSFDHMNVPAQLADALSGLRSRGLRPSHPIFQRMTAAPLPPVAAENKPVSKAGPVVKAAFKLLGAVAAVVSLPARAATGIIRYVSKKTGLSLEASAAASGLVSMGASFALVFLSAPLAASGVLLLMSGLFVAYSEMLLNSARKQQGINVSRRPLPPPLSERDQLESELKKQGIGSFARRIIIRQHFEEKAGKASTTRAANGEDPLHWGDHL